MDDNDVKVLGYTNPGLLSDEETGKVVKVNVSNGEPDTLPKSGKNKPYVIEIVQPDETEQDGRLKRKRKRFTLSYEVLVWTIFVIVTTLCIVDHFVFKGDIVLERSGKLPSKIWGKNPGETTTNIVWAVTARLIITSQNLMFYTTLWCIPNFFCEIAPKWITMDGIRDIHLKIHTFTGIFLIAIPSLAHVLVIFVPPLVDGTSIKYYPRSTFNYSNSLGYLNWSKPWDPAAVENWTFNDEHGVHLTSDELYRLLIMIILFCFLFPFSRSNYANQRSYSMAMALHVFAGIWYAIDNIRKITHGLAHVFNVPMLLIWCIDRLISIWLYRHHNGKIVRKEVIGNNEYVVVYIKLDKSINSAIGDVYYILHQVTKKSGIVPQRSHPFTTFTNLSKDRSWDIGLVMTVMEDEKQLCLPWTNWIAANKETVSFNTWGPYRSAVCNLYNQLLDESNDVAAPSHYVLLATGSGCGYLMDVLSTLAYKTGPVDQNKSEKIIIDIHYSVRCTEFYIFLREHIETLLKEIKKNNSAIVNLTFYVTSGNVNVGGLDDEDVDEMKSEINFVNGRIDFEKVLRSTTTKSNCYFVGRPAIAESVDKICKKKGLKLIKDYTDGPGKEKDRRTFIKYMKMTFKVICFIVVICVISRFMIDIKEIKNSLKSSESNFTM